MTLFVEQVGDVVESITPPQPVGEVVGEKLMIGSRKDSLAQLEVVGEEEKIGEFGEERAGREGGEGGMEESIDLGEDKPLEGTEETIGY